MPFHEANGAILLPGDAPYDVTFTPAVARRVLQLSLCPTKPNGLVGLWRQLTPRSQSSLETAMQHEAELYNVWSSYKSDFAGLNGHDSWPSIPHAQVLEEVWVESDPVSHLVFTTDGRRFTRIAGKLYTFAEFRAMYGRSVTSHVNGLAYDRVQRMQRALELLQYESPFVVSVQLASDAGMEEHALRVYDASQAVVYARRQHKICCTIDGESPP